MDKPKISSIENRPSQLYELPYYSSLPELPIHIDMEGSIGRFLAYDIFLLDGVQPVEGRHLKANDGIIGVYPSVESLKIHEKEKVSFQIIHVVVNAYGFALIILSTQSHIALA